MRSNANGVKSKLPPWHTGCPEQKQKCSHQIKCRGLPQGPVKHHTDYQSVVSNVFCHCQTDDLSSLPLFGSFCVSSYCTVETRLTLTRYTGPSQANAAKSSYCFPCRAQFQRPQLIAEWHLHLIWNSFKKHTVSISLVDITFAIGQPVQAQGSMILLEFVTAVEQVVGSGAFSEGFSVLALPFHDRVFDTGRMR